MRRAETFILMNKEFLDIILAVSAVVAALAIAATCAVGLVVWLAGGKLDQRKDEKAL